MFNWSFQYTSKGKATQIINKGNKTIFFRIFDGSKMLELFVSVDHVTLNYRIKFCLLNKMILFIFHFSTLI